MKKFSKVLCLVLVVVMMAGLCAVGTNAAFTDAEKITYKEAVDVLTAIGVIDGMGDGTFAPEATLNRAQAAKIITYVLQAEGMTAKSTFKDMKGYEWADSYVAYCQNAGIISGVGNGKFDPAGTLTGYQFAKMLLCATGLNADAEGMIGDGWEIGTAKVVKETQIARRITGFNGSAPLTREAACELALQAMQLNTSTYTSGTSITGTNLVVNTAGSYNGSRLAGPDLLTNAATFNVTVTPGGTDDFGRTTTDYDRIGNAKFSEIHLSFASKPVVTFTDKIQPAGIVNALKGYTFNGTKLTSKTTQIGATTTAIGEMPFGAATDVIATVLSGLTGNGTLVEVYANPLTKAVTNVVVVTYATQKLTSITKNAAGDVTYTLGGNGYTDYADEDTTDEIVFATAPAKGDVVTYAVSDDTTTVYVYPTTKFEGIQSASSAAALTISDKVYKLSTAQTGSFANSTVAANYFLDQYGYVVMTDAIETVPNYAVVDKIALLSGVGTSTTVSAEAVLSLANGTVETVKVGSINGLKASSFTSGGPTITLNANKVATAVALDTVVGNNAATLAGKIVTYVVNDKGLYDLTFVEMTASASNTWTKTGSVSSAGNVTTHGRPTFAGGTANVNTVFLVETGTGATQKFTAYTGYAGVPTITYDGVNAIPYAYTTNAQGAVTFVYIDATGGYTAASATIKPVLFTTIPGVTTVGAATGTQTFTMTGIVDGVAMTTLTAKTASVLSTAAAAGNLGKFYEVTKDESGFVTNLVDKSGSVYAVAAEANLPAGGVFNGYAYDGTETVYVIEDGAVTTGDMSSVSIGDSAYVVPAGTTGTAQYTIGTLYVVK